MTPEDKLAREWSDDYLAYVGESNERKEECSRMYAAAMFIQKRTDPLTMEGVEWSNAIHLLAGADWESTPVVMIEPCDSDTITVLSLLDQEIWTADSASLVPNGKRYTMTELTELGKLDKTAKPARPEFLETLEDFKNAPDGTIVVLDEGSGFPWIKSNSKWWLGDFSCTAEEMEPQNKGHILRKGW